MSEEKKPNSLNAAMAAFQAELPQVARSSTADAGKYTYDYADLADISAAVLPLLGKHGLSWSTQPTVTETGFALIYALSHESGENISGVYPLPLATMPAQQLGAAITYARRYALCAVTGVAPGGDDTDAAVEPSEDWEAMIHGSNSVEEMDVIASLLRETGEGTPKLRIIFAARQGVLKSETEASKEPTETAPSEMTEAQFEAESAKEFDAEVIENVVTDAA